MNESPNFMAVGKIIAAQRNRRVQIFTSISSCLIALAVVFWAVNLVIIAEFDYALTLNLNSLATLLDAYYVKMIDLETLGVLGQIEEKQCIIVGETKRNFQGLIDVSAEQGVIMGGETRRLYG